MSSDLLSGINSAIGEGTERLLAASQSNHRICENNSARTYGTDSIGSFSGSYQNGTNDNEHTEQEVRHTYESARERYERFSCASCMKNTFSFKNVKRKLPILGWGPQYRLPHLQGDVIAGLTVGLTVIPQGLAYAQIAELSPEYGLYSAFMGCFIYCIMGTSKDITLGPTAIMSLMTAAFGISPIPNDPTFAVVLALFTGIFQFFMGLFSLGFLVDFISYPVINSFTTSAAITIACGQVKKWLGLEHISREFLHMVYETCEKIPETKIWDFVLGLVCMILLVLTKKMKQYKFADVEREGICRKIIRNFFWIVGTARNAVIVIGAAAVLAILESNNINVLTPTGDILGGLPKFKVPDFSIHTKNVTVTTSEMFSTIGVGFVIVPILSVVETMAIGKAFARMNNYKIDTNQELLAIGVSNIMGSFVQSYAVTGSFSRTAVNSQSGVKTPAGGVWTGALVILALAVLTPWFYYIPQAGLAAVIIIAVLDMVSFSLVKTLWKVKKLDLIPWFTTFIFSFVLGIEYGIIIGVGVSLLMLLHPWARPGVKLLMREDLAVMTLNEGVLFPGVEYLKERIWKEANKSGTLRSIILDCSHISTLDYSAVQGFQSLLVEFRTKDVHFIMACVRPHIYDVLMRAGFSDMRFADTVEEGAAIIQGLDDNMIDKISVHENANMTDGTSNIMEIDSTDGLEALDSRSFHGSTPRLASEEQGLTSSNDNANEPHRAIIESRSSNNDLNV